MEYLSDTNMFGLESMGGAHGSNRGNPFAGANASLSMGGGPFHASNSASVMQGVEMGSAGGVPAAPPLTMMDPLQEVSTGNSAPVNGGMGEMYQSFMSYLANRSFGGNALSGQLSPPLPRPVEHVQQQQQQPHHQHFTSSQPSSALQSRRPSQSPSAPGSTVSSPGTPWSVISALSAINTSSPSTVLNSPMWAQTHDASVPASPPVLQGMVSPNYMRSELLGYAGSLGSTHRQPQQPARQTQPTPGFPGFNGRIDASMFGNMYAETQMGRPAFGVHERVPNGSGMMAVDPREDMVEMGLSTESGMDAGWMSFMHNAGIMEYNGPGGGQHQMPL